MAKAIKIIERKRRQQQHIDVRRYWTVCVRTYGFLHELHFSSSIFFMLLCGGWINTSKWYRKFSTSKAFHTTHPQSSELWQRNPRLFHAYFSSIPSPLHRLLCTVANIADKYNEQNNRKIFSTTYVWRDFFYSSSTLLLLHAIQLVRWLHHLVTESAPIMICIIWYADD